jgi:hypothetical protein
MQSPYLTVKEVAALFGKSTKWVYLRQAEIPGAFRVAGSIFFDREILESSLKELASAPTPKRVRACPNKHGLA